MAKRSLCVAPALVATVKQKFKNSPYPSQTAFANDCYLSRDTVRKFLNGHAIDQQNFLECCRLLGLDWQALVVEQGEDSGGSDVFDPEFVGREDAIADLDQLVAQGKRCILILSPGGSGKTTLAEQYLLQRFEPNQILECLIGKETQNITPAESWLEAKLRDLGEEPGHDFMIALGRLKAKLSTGHYGVLIDNLEPALDELGCFISEHRSYVEIFKVLLSSSTKTVTLIVRIQVGGGVDKKGKEGSVSRHEEQKA